MTGWYSMSPLLAGSTKPATPVKTFGAYVAVVIKVLSQPAVPFAVSFTSAFIALYLIEALALRRLFAS